MQVMDLNIVMIGAGALGMLFAGKCAQGYERIKLIAHSSAQAELIAEQGVLWTDENKMQHNVKVNCGTLSSLSEMREGAPAWIFLFVKQQHITAEFVRQLYPLTSQGAAIVCFQNGLGHIERLTQWIPKEQIFTAITTEASLKRSANEVVHTGKGETWLGPVDSEQPDRTFDLHIVKKVLRNAGFSVNLSKNMESLIWKKLLINAVINPLTAVLKVQNGQILSRPEWRELAKALFMEGLAVAESHGVAVSRQWWEQLVDVCEATAMNKSSMLQDLLAGRKTEIDWINGALIQLAETKQVAVPTHRMLYKLIKERESTTAFSGDKL